MTNEEKRELLVDLPEYMDGERRVCARLEGLVAEATSLATLGGMGHELRVRGEMIEREVKRVRAERVTR